MDQQQNFAVLGHGALASREHDFPHVQGDARIKLLFGVERLVAGVADEIVGHPQAIGVFRYCSLKPCQRNSQSESQKTSCLVEILGLHAKYPCHLLFESTPYENYRVSPDLSTATPALAQRPLPVPVVEREAEGVAGRRLAWAGGRLSPSRWFRLRTFLRLPVGWPHAHSS